MNPGNAHQRLPEWFKVPLSTEGQYARVRRLLRTHELRTVCQSAACPNRNECWNSGTATFLILGDRCTRRCRFCNVPQGAPAPQDREEPERVARAVTALGLSHVVVTSVTRDDLPDGGAGLFAATVRAIRQAAPGCRIEVLVPDLQGDAAALSEVLDSAPDILNHNVETVPSLYPHVRPQADYARSLAVLESAKKRGSVTKSGIMLGLGERREEVRAVLTDLRGVGCDILTVGQYLQPRRDLLPVARFYRPEEFILLRDEAMAMGFTAVSSGPRVRSSYHAASHCARALRTIV